MFVRIRKNGYTKNRSVVICHSVRINGDNKQILVKVFGHSNDDLKLQFWFTEAKNWIKDNAEVWLKTQFPIKKFKLMKKNNVSLFDLEERARINVGIDDIFGKLYEELGFSSLLSPKHQEILKKVLFARLLEPGSKRRLSQVAEADLGEALPLDKIYRMMDALNKVSTQVEQKIFQATERALKSKISLVLFDVTTLSFESIAEDELRAFGFSKDFKFNTTQVTLALASTQEGLPVGYRLFPGNTAESKTLIESVRDWREKIPIGDVTIIGDRAMMSESNLSTLEQAGFKYIVSYPLRKLSKVDQALVFDEKSYLKTETDKEISRYRIIEHKNRKLIISYSPKRASKDSKDRERLVAKLKKKLQSCKNVKSLINKNGYLKYTEIAGKAEARIDEEKIANDAKWDGLHAIITNNNSGNITFYEKYHRLWVIEESFRINKHDLKMRPIFHFTPKRIKAHILLCYMTFALIRHMQYKLQKLNQSMSAKRIIDAIRDVEASILVNTVNDNKYRMLSKLNDDAKIIYNTLKINKGLNIVAIN